MKIHTTSTGAEGLLLSSGTFIPLWTFSVALNVQDLSISTRDDRANLSSLSSLSSEDRQEFYDYMICRWLAAKNAMVREMWSEVGSPA